MGCVPWFGVWSFWTTAPASLKGWSIDKKSLIFQVVGWSYLVVHCSDVCSVWESYKFQLNFLLDFEFEIPCWTPPLVIALLLFDLLRYYFVPYFVVSRSVNYTGLLSVTAFFFFSCLCSHLCFYGRVPRCGIYKTRHL